MTILKKLNKFISVILCLTLCLSCVTVTSADTDAQTDTAGQAESADKTGTAGKVETADADDADDAADSTETTAETATESVTAESVTETADKDDTDESTESTTESAAEPESESSAETTTDADDHDGSGGTGESIGNGDDPAENESGGTDGTGDQVESPAAVNISTIAAFDGIYELYVNFESGSDEKDGKSEANAVKTMEHAIALAEQMHDSENKATVDIFAVNTYHMSEDMASSSNYIITWQFEDYMNVYTDTAAGNSLVEVNFKTLPKTHSELHLNGLNFYGGTVVKVPETNTEEGHSTANSHDLDFSGCVFNWTADTDGWIIDAVTAPRTNLNINIGSSSTICEFHGKQQEDGSRLGNGVKWLFTDNNVSTYDGIDLTAYAKFDSLNTAIGFYDKSADGEVPHKFAHHDAVNGSDYMKLNNTTFSNCTTGINYISYADDCTLDWTKLTFSNCDTAVAQWDNAELKNCEFDNCKTCISNMTNNGNNITNVTVVGNDTGDTVFIPYDNVKWGETADLTVTNLQMTNVPWDLNCGSMNITWNNCQFKDTILNPETDEDILLGLRKGKQIRFNNCAFNGHKESVLLETNNAYGIAKEDYSTLYTEKLYIKDTEFKNDCYAAVRGYNVNEVEFTGCSFDGTYTAEAIDVCFLRNTYVDTILNHKSKTTFATDADDAERDNIFRNNSGIIYNGGWDNDLVLENITIDETCKNPEIYIVDYRPDGNNSLSLGSAECPKLSDIVLNNEAGLSVSTKPGVFSENENDIFLTLWGDPAGLAHPINVEMTELTLPCKWEDGTNCSILEALRKNYIKIPAFVAGGGYQLKEQDTEYINVYGVGYPTPNTIIFGHCTPGETEKAYFASAFDVELTDNFDYRNWTEYAAAYSAAPTANTEYVWKNSPTKQYTVVSDRDLHTLQSDFSAGVNSSKNDWTADHPGYKFVSWAYSADEYDIENNELLTEGTLAKISDEVLQSFDFSSFLYDNEKIKEFRQYTFSGVWEPIPELSIDKKIVSGDQLVTANSARPGDEVEYEITVRNTGGVAVNIQAEDTLAQNVSSAAGSAEYSLEYVSDDASGVTENNTVKWTIDGLGQNQEKKIRLKTKIKQSAV